MSVSFISSYPVLVQLAGKWIYDVMVLKGRTVVSDRRGLRAGDSGVLIARRDLPARPLSNFLLADVVLFHCPVVALPIVRGGITLKPSWRIL
jgi:hypothetical protein